VLSGSSSTPKRARENVQNQKPRLLIRLPFCRVAIDVAVATAVSWGMGTNRKRPPEAYASSSLFEQGIGHITLARFKTSGKTEIGVFLVDIYCLGVKDAFFTPLWRRQVSLHRARPKPGIHVDSRQSHRFPPGG
jgi:hypothetical protein